jgi:sugar-specific transcriptional regulator TrmB
MNAMETTSTKLTTTPQMFGRCGFDDVGVLVGLGLSVRQARVYLALLRAGVARVQVVSDLSRVHRQEVYRVLDVLQQMGLVVRKVSNPATFSVTPLSEAVKLLLGQKTCELDLVAKRAEQLSKRLSSSAGSLEEFTLRPCFGEVVEADRGRHYRVAIKGVHKVFEVVTGWRRFKQLSIHFDTQLLGALRRSVAVHLVTEKPPLQPLPKWVSVAQAKYPLFELRTMPEQPTAAITIFDHKQAAIAYNPNISLTKGPEMWTENTALAALAQAYFKTVWAQSFAV